MTPQRPSLCIIAHSADLYGADRCLHAALPELVRQYRVTVVVPSPGPGIEVLKRLGAEVLRLPDYALRRRHLTPKGFLPWLYRLVVTVRTLSRVHKEQRFVAVYSNTLAAGVGPLLRLRWRIPHVVHVHECPTEPPWLPRTLLRIVRRTTQLVICNSRSTANWVIASQPSLSNRVVVVHNGLDLVAAPSEPPSTHSPFTISCVARIHPKKGQNILLEALRMSTERGRDWKVELYGDTLAEYLPLFDQLIAYAAQHDLTDRIIWKGFRPDIEDQYRNADVAVVPSVVPEEFSLVCLEAQSMLLAVIATGPGGASEVVLDGETGLIIPPRDAAALFTAICRLEDDIDLRHAMGRAGRTRAETLFSREKYAAGICSQLDKLISSASSGRGRA